MNLEELKKAESDLKKKHEKEIIQLRIDYAKAHTKFEKGQILDDGVSRLLVDDIKYSAGMLYGPPCAVYVGFEMTKQNKPKKNKARGSIYQNRKIKVVG